MRPAALVFATGVLASAPAAAQNQHMEIIHHPNYDMSVFMPFVPAIKIRCNRTFCDGHHSAEALQWRDVGVWGNRIHSEAVL